MKNRSSMSDELRVGDFVVVLSSQLKPEEWRVVSVKSVGPYRELVERINRKLFVLKSGK